jgi:hypothetical protein
MIKYFNSILSTIPLFKLYNNLSKSQNITQTSETIKKIEAL